MVKYYRVTAHTPFCGEENDYYIATDSLQELHEFMDECAYDNGLEWYEDDLEMDDATYFDECYCDYEEILEFEYLQETRETSKEE